MKTLLINESMISQFKFWQEGQIHLGMNCRNGLYRFVSRFTHHHRNQAFDYVWSLEQEGKEVVVTATASYYTVWALLQSPQAAIADPVEPKVPVHA